MRAVAIVLVLAACDAASSDPGYGALLQLDGAQYEPGPLPSPAGGPEVVDAFLPRTVVEVGEVGLRLQGSLEAGANGVAVALDGDDGHWIVPSGIPDVFDPTRPTIDVDVGFARVLAAGPRAMRIAALDADGRAGEPWTIDLDVRAAAIPEGSLVFTLRWDTPTDLDLRVITPDGIEVWSRNINSYAPPAPGQPPDPPDAWMSGGILDVDSNARCVIDGRQQENVVWTVEPPPAGRYEVRVDAFSLCGEAAARWVVEARIGGEVVASASGLATFEDTAGAHDAGAGVRALEVEVP